MIRDSATEEAVWALGGVEPVAAVCGVSVANVYKWRHLGRVTNALAAFKLAKASRDAGVPMTAERLVGYVEPNGSGGELRGDVGAGHGGSLSVKPVKSRRAAGAASARGRRRRRTSRVLAQSADDRS